MLSVAPTQIDDWLSGRYSLAKATKRSIWILWSLTFEPANLKTTLDVMTWGKWSKWNVVKVDNPADTWEI
jgi:hypothetical protein